MLEIGAKLCLKGTWETGSVPEGRLGVTLVPSISFGDGSHPSTRLFLEEMEELVTPGITVIDAGTGSGILAIAAIRLGAAKVYAIDISKVALFTAMANLEANGLTSGEVELLRATYEGVEFSARRPAPLQHPRYSAGDGGHGDWAFGLLPAGGRFATMPPQFDVGRRGGGRAGGRGFTVLRKISTTASGPTGSSKSRRLLHPLSSPRPACAPSAARLSTYRVEPL